jgi:hypothetical protein
MTLRKTGVRDEQPQREDSMIKRTSMTKGSWSFAIAVLLGLTLVPSAFAQDAVKSDIPFAFHVGAKTLPAGPYEFKIDLAARTVSVIGAKGSSAAEMFETTLAPAQHSSEAHSHIVFDKVGTTYTLSELWQPGMDGILVYATKGKHEHEVIHIKK